LNKIDKLKSRLGFAPSWDSEYLEEDDQEHNSTGASGLAAEFLKEGTVATTPKDPNGQVVSIGSSSGDRRHSPNSPFASGAAPSAVKRHVRRPDLKRASEISGREVRNIEESRRYAGQPRIGPDGSTSFKPREFSEALLIANHLKEGKTVSVDLSLIENAQKQRFIDFMAGLVYALDGHLARSSVNVYILTPR